ncbi:MAG: sulfatase activating formylglycine-generating enzyme [Chlamydiales bacterium]|jgi:formylglycine-generating enzyme required for sulfatase activity
MKNTNFQVLGEVSYGDYIGDYQVLNTLGRGPIGTTYHVISRVLGKEFAMKSLTLLDNFTIEWLDRLEAQISLLGKLTHFHIDRVINSGRSGKFWYTLKDYVHDGDGSSCNLRQYIERHGRRLSHHQVFHISIQILEALHYAAEYKDSLHEGVFHGNLKPENVLVSFSSRSDRASMRMRKLPFEVCVSDFQPYGLIDESAVLAYYYHRKKVGEDVSEHLSDKSLREALTSIYRPFDYRAPEIRNQTMPSAQSDIFSIGVMIYEMLTGEIPCGKFPSLSKRRFDISPFWDEVVHKCLQYSADKRYTSARELLDELQNNFDERLGEEDTVDVVKIPIRQPAGGKVREGRDSLTPPGMVYIPAGSFFVGSAECGEDALPQHECSTLGFYIDRVPVTNGLFARFVQETGYVTEAEEGEGAPLWGDGQWKVLPGISWRSPTGQTLPPDFDLHPVTQVTYADTLAYAEWLGRRLPTEKEWEYAARGGQKDIHYPWGNTITRSNANFSGDSTTPVMQYQANGYGLYDIAGNVWEWSSSWYEAYPGNSVENPHFGEKYKVVRGGAWMYDAFHCMVSYRNANQAENCYPTLGFRTAYDFVPSK